MALKPCKSCKHTVDASAKTCPNCGVANPGVTTGSAIGGVILLVIIIGAVVSMCSGGKSDKPEDAQAEKQAQIDDAACRKDLQCAGDKFTVAVGVYCKDMWHALLSTLPVGQTAPLNRSSAISVG